MIELPSAQTQRAASKTNKQIKQEKRQGSWGPFRGQGPLEKKRLLTTIYCTAQKGIIEVNKNDNIQ